MAIDGCTEIVWPGSQKILMKTWYHYKFLRISLHRWSIQWGAIITRILSIKELFDDTFLLPANQSQMVKVNNWCDVVRRISKTFEWRLRFLLATIERKENLVRPLLLLSSAPPPSTYFYPMVNFRPKSGFFLVTIFKIIVNSISRNPIIWMFFLNQ